MAQEGSSRWMMHRKDVDLSSLPQIVDLSPSRLSAILFTVFGVVWIPGVWVNLGRIANPDRIVTAVGMGALLVGIVVLIVGLKRLGTVFKATLQADGVAFKRRSPLNSETWFVPYSAFMGVARSDVLVSRTPKRGSNIPSRTVHIVELLHEDEANSVPLYASAVPVDAVGADEHVRRRWESYARTLGLPAIELDHGSSSGLQARDSDELDTPLRQRVRDGSADPAIDPGVAPPAGLKVVQDGDGVSSTITITARRTPIWFFGFFLLPFAGLTLFSFGLHVLPTFVGVMSFAILPLPVFLYLRDRRTHRVLTVGRDGLRVTDPLTPTRQGQTFIAIQEIESIGIRRERGNLGDELVISGDDARMHIGIGLSREALIWLKGFLTRTIATN